MTRISYKEIAPGAYRSMLGLERYVGESGLEHSLLELVRTRASQLNGCAFCLDMHSKDAIAAGETPQRLLVLSAWRDAPFYTERVYHAVLDLYFIDGDESPTIISRSQLRRATSTVYPSLASNIRNSSTALSLA